MNRSRPTLLPLLLATALLAVACAEEDSSDATLTPTSFSSDASALLCEKLFSCCDETQRQAFLDQLSITADDVESCTQSYETFLGAFFAAPLDASVDAERASFDAQAAADCLDLAEARSCADFFADPNAIICPALISGLVAEGDTCTESFECVAGLFCKAEAGAEEGTCATPPAEGEACTFTCAEGLYCDGAGFCAQKKQNALACTSGQECASGYCADNENGQFCDAPPVVCEGT